jgi:hypothetical protein
MLQLYCGHQCIFKQLWQVAAAQHNRLQKVGAVISCSHGDSCFCATNKSEGWLYVGTTDY